MKDEISEGVFPNSPWRTVGMDWCGKSGGRNKWRKKLVKDKISQGSFHNSCWRIIGKDSEKISEGLLALFFRVFLGKISR